MDIYEILAKGTVTFVTGVGAAWIGVWIYFRQKEYELVKTRYLEGSLDIISSELEKSLGILNHNWARCLNIVKAFRDEKEHFDIKELEKGFVEYDASKFESIAHHRLQNLVGSTVFWSSYQLALAFVNSSNSIITKEITSAIRVRLETDRISAPIEEVVDKAFIELKRLHDESHRYSLITEQLQLIADRLEKEKMGFSSIKRFNKDQVVKSAISCIEDEFKSEILKLINDA